MKRASEDVAGIGGAEEASWEQAAAGECPIVILPEDIDVEALLAFDAPVDESVYEAAVFDLIDGEIEFEVEEELAAGGAGLKRIFAMPKFCGVIAVSIVALLSVLFTIGKGYYLLPISQRPLHYLHEALRPSGVLGLTLGIGGAAFLLATLAYVIRKNLVSWARHGALRGWMGFHIFAGLMGPALVVFHAALVPYSALGSLAFFSMLIIVLSGIVGRYIYIHFPRSLEGRELEVGAIRKRLAVYRKKLVDLGIDPALLRVDEAGERRSRSPWLIEAVIRVACGDRESRKEFQRLQEAIGSQLDLHPQFDRILLLVRKLCRERQWLVRYQEFRKLMGAWRFLHRWLAIITLMAVFFHVVIGLRFGN
jgi:hypothetical protein